MTRWLAVGSEPTVVRPAADTCPGDLVAAIRDPDDDRVPGPSPGPAHEHLGWLHPDLALDRRGAFAAVARSRRLRAPADDALREVAAALRTIERTRTDLAPLRERVAAAGAERDRLRERVATLRGRVQARREAGLDAADATEELRTAARRLSEATTEREAAEQALARAREAARDAYDARERRLALEDRAANLQREARATLADRIRPLVDAALTALDAPPHEDAADHTVALAAATVARFRAPVVYELDRLAPTDAAERFDTAVVRP